MTWSYSFYAIPKNLNDLRASIHSYHAGFARLIRNESDYFFFHSADKLLYAHKNVRLICGTMEKRVRHLIVSQMQTLI